MQCADACTSFTRPFASAGVGVEGATAAGVSRAWAAAAGRAVEAGAGAGGMVAVAKGWARAAVVTGVGPVMAAARGWVAARGGQGVRASCAGADCTDDGNQAVKSRNKADRHARRRRQAAIPGAAPARGLLLPHGRPACTQLRLHDAPCPCTLTLAVCTQLWHPGKSLPPGGWRQARPPGRAWQCPLEWTGRRRRRLSQPARRLQP